MAGGKLVYKQVVTALPYKEVKIALWIPITFILKSEIPWYHYDNL